MLDKSQKQKTINLVDLYDLPPQYESTNLTEKLEKNWSDDIKHYPDKPSLFRATIRSVTYKPFLIGCLFLPPVSISTQCIQHSFLEETSSFHSTIINYIFNGFF